MPVENQSKLMCVTRDDSIQQAAARMRDRNSQSLSVLGVNREIVGTVSARNIVTQATAQGDDPHRTPVAAVMTTHAGDEHANTNRVGDFGADQADRTRYGHAPEPTASR